MTNDTHVVIGGGILIDCNKGCDGVEASPPGEDAMTGCNKVALCKPMVVGKCPSTLVLHAPTVNSVEVVFVAPLSHS